MGIHENAKQINEDLAHLSLSTHDAKRHLCKPFYREEEKKKREKLFFIYIHNEIWFERKSLHLNCMKSIKILAFFRLIGLCHSWTDCFQATMQILVCVCLSFWFAAIAEKLPKIVPKLMLSDVIHNFRTIALFRKKSCIYSSFGNWPKRTHWGLFKVTSKWLLLF